MKEAADEPTQARRKLLVNLGSGPKTQSRLPAMFADWREFRVDVDPGAVPDLVADITDLSAIKSGTVELSGRPTASSIFIFTRWERH